MEPGTWKGIAIGLGIALAVNASWQVILLAELGAAGVLYLRHRAAARSMAPDGEGQADLDRTAGNVSLEDHVVGRDELQDPADDVAAGAGGRRGLQASGPQLRGTGS